MLERFLEDFEVGQKFTGPARLRVELERIKSFAAEFDPQPFHADDVLKRRFYDIAVTAIGDYIALRSCRGPERGPSATLLRAIAHDRFLEGEC